MKYLLLLFIFFFSVTFAKTSIIYFHGLGGNKTGALDIGLRSSGTIHLENHKLRIDSNTMENIKDTSRNSGEPYYFTYEYDYSQSIQYSAKFIRKALSEFPEEDSLILIGYSYGGLISRYYLQKYQDQRVIKYISIATPHLGSPLAYLYHLKDQLDHEEFRRKFENDESFFSKFQMKLKELIEKVENNMSIESKTSSVFELQPANNSNFLDKFQSKKHPTEVEYYCIIAKREYQEIFNFFEFILPNNAEIDSFMDFLKRVDQFINGDYVVPIHSQNIANCQYFFQNGINVQTDTINATHFTVLENLKEPILEWIHQ